MTRLDDRAAKNLPGPEAGKSDFVHWDAELKGFGLRVLASGRRTWIVRYRLGTAQRVIRIGQLAQMRAADARRQAQRILARKNLGEDERASIKERKAKAAQPAKQTFGTIVRRYLEFVKGKQKISTYVETERYLAKYALGLHSTPIQEIDRRQIADLMERISAGNGPIAANRLYAKLSACFTWAIKRGYAEENPVARTEKAIEEKARDRTLSVEELCAVWMATGDSGHHSKIVRLLILTGARRNEVAGMRWSELDLDRAEWQVPGERTKNGRPLSLPLSDAALELLHGCARRDGREFVFGEGAGPFSGFSKSKERLNVKIAELRARANDSGHLDADLIDAARLPAWTLHDLRRTFVTLLNEELAVQPHVVEALVNHISGHKAGVAGVYNRALYATEKREALQRWATWLQQKVGGEMCIGIRNDARSAARRAPALKTVNL